MLNLTNALLDINSANIATRYPLAAIKFLGQRELSRLILAKLATVEDAEVAKIINKGGTEWLKDDIALILTFDVAEKSYGTWIGLIDLVLDNRLRYKRLMGVVILELMGVTIGGGDLGKVRDEIYNLRSVWEEAEELADLYQALMWRFNTLVSRCGKDKEVNSVPPKPSEEVDNPAIALINELYYEWVYISLIPSKEGILAGRMGGGPLVRLPTNRRAVLMTPFNPVQVSQIYVSFRDRLDAFELSLSGGAGGQCSYADITNLRILHALICLNECDREGQPLSSVADLVKVLKVWVTQASNLSYPLSFQALISQLEERI